jgi:hypothetical protein
VTYDRRVTYAYGPPPSGEPGSPISPITNPMYLPPPPPQKGRATVVAALVVGLVVAAAGLALGWLWSALAPRIDVIRVAQGFIYAEAEPEQPVAADGYFAFLGLGVGVLITLVAWFALRRYRGVLMMIALVLGSLVGAWLAWWLGTRIGTTQFDAAKATAAVGEHIRGPLSLRLTDLDRHALWPPRPTGVIAAQALAAAITYTLLAGFSAHPNLRGPTPSPELPAEEAGVPY